MFNILAQLLILSFSLGPNLFAETVLLCVLGLQMQATTCKGL